MSGNQATGTNNIFIGTNSGNSNSGTGNIFIGTAAGLNLTTVSNKLIIENSGNTNTPLIEGDFFSNSVEINGSLCYTGTFGACSDIRFKKDIKPIENALSRILSIQGIRHNWRVSEFDKEWKDEPTYGVIAQELEKEFPYLVSEDEEGFKYVDYSKITPILIEALKEQQIIIKNQSNKIKDLEKTVSKISKLELLLSQLQNDTDTLKQTLLTNNN